MMKTRKWIQILTAIMVALMISACGGGTSSVTANAGTDKIVHVGRLVQLDARNSVTDPEWLYHFRWEVTSRPSGSAAALSSTSALNPSFVPDKVGEYTVELKVTADGVGSDVDTVKITATNAAPTANDLSLTLDVDQASVGIDWRSASGATDADGDSLSISIVSDGTDGQCVLMGDTLTYLKTNEGGETDHCTLALSDGFTSTNVSVTVTSLYWEKISSKTDFTIALKSDGTVWGWGANLYGQLGDDTTLDRDHPVQEATHATDWVDVAVGAYHSLAIKSDGSLYAWGGNMLGQLGDGTYDDRHQPKLIDSDHNWLKVTAGSRFSVALRSDHTLWSWGENFLGKTLGIGIGGSHNTPVQVNGTEWADVSAGDIHTLAIKTDGTLYSWGVQYSSDGRLGDDSGTSQSSPVQIGTADNWSFLSAAAYDSFAINEDGELYAWGRNSSGILGVGDFSKKTTPTHVGSATWKWISGGMYHAMGIQEDGSLWGWGENKHAQRGDATFFARNEPIQIGSDVDWTSVSAAKTTSIALKTNGVVYGWGYNEFGQLGNGKTDTMYVPTQILQEGGHTWKKISIGLSHVLAIRDDKTLWAWGYNGSGEFGNDQISSSYTYTPVQEHHGYTDWIDVSAGTFFSVALREDNTLWTWGSNSYGKLGLSQDYAALHYKKVPTQVGTAHWISISTGQDHAAAIRKDSYDLYLWGSNASGQLGVGDYTDRDTPTQDASGLSWESVSCGQAHTMAIKKVTDINFATLYGWGSNYYGQLGIDSTDNSKNTPNIVSDGWRSVAAGKYHTIGIKVDDTLWGWGSNKQGEAGQGLSTENVISPAQIGTYSPWILIAAGGRTSIAVDGNEHVWVWGENTRSLLGKDKREIPLSRTPIEIPALASTTVTDQVAVGEHSIGFLKADGALWTWGVNDYKQLARDWYTQEPASLIERD